MAMHSQPWTPLQDFKLGVLSALFKWPPGKMTLGRYVDLNALAADVCEGRGRRTEEALRVHLKRLRDRQQSSLTPQLTPERWQELQGPGGGDDLCSWLFGMLISPEAISTEAIDDKVFRRLSGGKAYKKALSLWHRNNNNSDEEESPATTPSSSPVRHSATKRRMMSSHTQEEACALITTPRRTRSASSSPRAPRRRRQLPPLLYKPLWDDEPSYGVYLRQARINTRTLEKAMHYIQLMGNPRLRPHKRYRRASSMGTAAPKADRKDNLAIARFFDPSRMDPVVCTFRVSEDRISARAYDMATQFETPSLGKTENTAAGTSDFILCDEFQAVVEEVLAELGRTGVYKLAGLADQCLYSATVMMYNGTETDLVSSHQDPPGYTTIVGITLEGSMLLGLTATPHTSATTTCTMEEGSVYILTRRGCHELYHSVDHLDRNKNSTRKALILRFVNKSTVEKLERMAARQASGRKPAS